MTVFAHLIAFLAALGQLSIDCVMAVGSIIERSFDGIEWMVETLCNTTYKNSWLSNGFGRFHRAMCINDLPLRIDGLMIIALVGFVSVLLNRTVYYAG